MTSKTWFYRDLAARNCMISADKVVKVGDLGLARHVYMTDFYHTSSNVGLPIRWMAPESIADRFFTSQSDVWSLGVGDVCFFLTMRCFNDAMFSNS